MTVDETGNQLGLPGVQHRPLPPSVGHILRPRSGASQGVSPGSRIELETQVAPTVRGLQLPSLEVSPGSARLCSTSGSLSR